MAEATKIERRTVELSAYPDLIVIHLGMKVHSLRGLWTLLRLGPQIKTAVEARPDGLLAHENMIFSLFPIHLGIRQYWRDFGALERWTLAQSHRKWWLDFLRDPCGTSFWHEVYSKKGGFEAIYLGDIPPFGFSAFAPLIAAKGPMFSAKSRLYPQAGDAAS